MANNFQDVQQGAIELIDRIKQEVKGLDAQVLKLNENVKKLTTSGGITPQKTVDQIKALEAEMTKLNSVIGKQTTQINKLKKAKSISNKKTSEEIVNQRSLAKSSDLYAKSQSKLVGSYQRLIAQKKRMKSELDRLTVSYGKNAEATKRMQSAYNKVDLKTKKLNRSFISLSKGGLRGAISGLRGLAAGFGLIGGAGVLASLIPQVFKLSKQFDAFSFAMRKIIDDSIELAETQEFLDDITQRYGVDLITTTERYIKFDAAARQSNLSLKETQRIFGTVTKAAGVLGLKTDELQGVYLALEQMLSKGKVTTEELRRQLGERLPGAFGIMAKAIGVSTRELDKMLKAGEVLSAEALPKFADELEKAYGIKAVNTIDTLQAAQTRLSNAWAIFIRDISGSDSIIQSVFKGVLNFMSSLLEGIKEVGSEIKEAFKTEATKAYEKSQNVFLNLQKKQVDELNKIINLNDKLNLALTRRSQIEGLLIEKMVEQGKYIFEGKEYSTSVETATKSIRQLVNEIESFNGSGKDAQSFLKNLSRDYNGLSDDLIATAFARIKGIDSVVNKTMEQLDAQKELNKENEEGNENSKKQIELLEGTVAWYKKQIQLAKEVRDNTALNTDEYQKQTEGIEKLEEALRMLIGARKNELESQKDNIGFGEGTNKADELLNDLVLGFDSYRRSIKESKEETKEFKDELNDFFKTFQDDFFSNAGFDFLGSILTEFDEFQAKLDESENDWAIWANSIMEVGQEAFGFLQQNQDAYFETQLYNLERERDIAIQFAGDSATAREEIERQYEEKRRAIQQKQAQAEKDQALFNIAIDTAQAVVAFLAQGNVPLSIAAGVIGAAQLAVVAARPVPEFFRGTMNAPEGMALVDEKQPEVHTDRSGNIKSFGESSANYRWLSSGDKIYKSHDEYFKKELSNVLSVNDIVPYREALSTSSPIVNVSSGIKKETFVREIRAMRSDIMNKETSITKIDKNGFYTGVRKKGAEIERQNNILKLKGGIV